MDGRFGGWVVEVFCKDACGSDLGDAEVILLAGDVNE
jgi:hypothetical protein